MSASMILNIISILLLLAAFIFETLAHKEEKFLVDKEEVLEVVKANGSDWKKTVKDIKSL